MKLNPHYKFTNKENKENQQMKKPGKLFNRLERFFVTFIAEKKVKMPFMNLKSS